MTGMEKDKQYFVKCAQLDLIKELKRICDKNNISYFLVGGTLIGAIRHNGYIPWDDDIDVGMLRPEYIRFIKACKRELDDQYAIYDWNIDKNSPLPFLKIKIKGTHYREQLSQNTEMNDEIFIDVFPYDNAPDNKVLQRIHGLRNIIIKKIILLRCGFTIDEGGVIKRGLYLPLKLLANIHTIEKWKKRYKINAYKYNHRKTGSVVSLGGSYAYKREIKNRTIVEKLDKHIFEDVELSVPKHYDRFLREVYGDYMQLPPENMRVSRHGISYIDMGDYVTRSRIGESMK